MAEPIEGIPVFKDIRKPEVAGLVGRAEYDPKTKKIVIHLLEDTEFTKQLTKVDTTRPMLLGLTYSGWMK